MPDSTASFGIDGGKLCIGLQVAGETLIGCILLSELSSALGVGKTIKNIPDLPDLPASLLRRMTPVERAAWKEARSNYKMKLTIAIQGGTA